MSRFVILLALTASAVTVLLCLWVLRQGLGAELLSRDAAPVFCEWPDQILDIGALASLPAAIGAGPFERRFEDGRLLGLFTVRPETCGQTLSEIVEFARVLEERERPTIQPALLVAADDREGVEWFVRTRDIALPTLYGPSSRQLEELRRFRGNEVYDQMVVVDPTSGSVVVRVPLSAGSTPLQGKRALVSMIGAD